MWSLDTLFLQSGKIFWTHFCIIFCTKFCDNISEIDLGKRLTEANLFSSALKESRYHSYYYLPCLWAQYFLNHSTKACLSMPFRGFVFIRCQGCLKWKHHEETAWSSEAPDFRELLCILTAQLLAPQLPTWQADEKQRPLRPAAPQLSGFLSTHLGFPCLRACLTFPHQLTCCINPLLMHGNFGSSISNIQYG